MTRFPEAVPLRSIRGKKVLEALIGFSTKFGIPKKLQSDCGTIFISRFFRKQMNELGICHVTSTQYHPKSQGQVERFHQTLKSVLNKFYVETCKKWDKEVPFALFAIRSVPNEALGFSPFELVFGYCVNGPLQALKEHWEGEAAEVNVLDYLSGLQEKFQNACVFAKENLWRVSRSPALVEATHMSPLLCRVYGISPSKVEIGAYLTLRYPKEERMSGILFAAEDRYVCVQLCTVRLCTSVKISVPHFFYGDAVYVCDFVVPQ
ncbi:uncharacterized protein [Palaemon carinicauda]|uniref:uncharacterized protein n=1 Tax=Palaemon carinicauda TaxID=392227 RepID=UPI0035B5FC7F